jgi:hypothetical protein
VTDTDTDPKSVTEKIQYDSCHQKSSLKKRHAVTKHFEPPNRRHCRSID